MLSLENDSQKRNTAAPDIVTPPKKNQQSFQEKIVFLCT